MTWLSGAALLATALLSGSLLYYYARTGAPPVPAKRREIDDVVALLREAGVADGARIYELGCGFGGMAVALARAFPEARVVGLELSPLPGLIAWLRARGVANLVVRRADFHRADLSDADAVACYLMIRPMVRLAETLDSMLRPGTPVVTLTFAFRGRRPWRERTGPGVRGTASLYRWPARPS